MSLFTTRGLVFGGFLEYPDVTVPDKTVCFLTGPSGCGKSTLFRLMNGSLSPSHGELLYNGLDVETIDPIHLRREVLLVGQSVFLFEDTIEGNFRQFYDYLELPVPSPADIKRFLELCCAPFDLEQDCTVLSGGERQRVYLSIFASMNPRVMLLDEPTSALDAETGRAVLQNLSQYCKNKEISLLVICHDDALSEQFAEQRIRLGSHARQSEVIV